MGGGEGASMSMVGSRSVQSCCAHDHSKPPDVQAIELDVLWLVVLLLSSSVDHKAIFQDNDLGPPSRCGAEINNPPWMLLMYRRRSRRNRNELEQATRMCASAIVCARSIIARGELPRTQTEN